MECVQYRLAAQCYAAFTSLKGQHERPLSPRRIQVFDRILDRPIEVVDVKMAIDQWD